MYYCIVAFYMLQYACMQTENPLMQAAKAEFKLVAGGACTQAKLKHRAKHPYATARCAAAMYGVFVLLQGATLQLGYFRAMTDCLA